MSLHPSNMIKISENLVAKNLTQIQKMAALLGNEGPTVTVILGRAAGNKGNCHRCKSTDEIDKTSKTLRAFWHESPESLGSPDTTEISMQFPLFTQASNRQLLRVTGS